MSTDNKANTQYETETKRGGGKETGDADKTKGNANFQWMVTENYIRYGKNRAPNLTQKSSFTHLQYPVHKEKMEMRRTEVFKLVIFLNIKKKW